ncbi:eukaryotic DNA topoisomerase I, catalytic core [Sphaeroforma arctica JP610]|uniref:DNA topoisomerase n=1 Tax=Sphaeroforma arctica JP610 TaxID=667725 RepID=A0A0L0F7P3_9EUKA|nr:eukaryotic DNA topoisomerase I, catalytic core [Sphaeroforma arctica JP610]KNC72143.1 eukaryotic DNA topoisomerase I, catalytic core [Sphaeroforma arctica JP610]|eukprot:XP_014146045.1 eukaryotic DNA topoisomerase I, catalytic core [Sphaeroforma arctica JP610]
MSIRQRGTALYVIDRLALRVGNEKDTSEEADTVGCCSLRVEHVTMEGDNQITLDFLGKDCIRYINTVEVIPQVYKNIKIFMQGKAPDIKIFDRLLVSLCAPIRTVVC